MKLSRIKGNLINEFNSEQVIRTEQLVCGVIGEDIHAISFGNESHFISPLLESLLVPISENSFCVNNNEPRLN